jgi:hypothetical protein
MVGIPRNDNACDSGHEVTLAKRGFVSKINILSPELPRTPMLSGKENTAIDPKILYDYFLITYRQHSRSVDASL